MTETKEKKELVVKERMQPETYFDVMDDYFNRLMRHPFSLLTPITKEDLNVTITENRITLSGEKKQEERIEKENYHWCERC